MHTTETTETAYSRAKLWQIRGFALNNMASNIYLFIFMYITYYMTGYVGVGVVLASSFVTVMRIWDAVTDPFIGCIVDRTSTRFGKNRPFMLAGNLIMMIGSGLMFHVTHHLPDKARFPAFIVMYMFYVVGYTFQNLVTKSAQTCLTNDPKQRPLFSIFDGINITILTVLIPMLFASVLVAKCGDFTDAVFHEAWMILAPISLLLTCIAIFSIASKDRPEFFGLGESKTKIGFKEYWDVLKNNRAIQMLVVSASTDKLAINCQGNATIMVIVFGIICGNYGLSGAAGAYTSIPSLLFLFFGAGVIATRLGQKKAMLLGTYGSLICCIGGVLLFYLGDPTTMAFPGFEGFHGWTSFTILYLILWIGFKGFSNISGNIVIPMTADCADYEVYRSGRYVPGIIGTLFSFVDKMISSIASTVIGLMCAAIGFVSELPKVDTPLTPQLKFLGIFGLFGLTIVGLVCNIIAMKFYPLSAEKMQEIQSEISAIKAKAQAGTAV